MALWGTAVVASMLWQSPELRAQIANSFTNPAGETRGFAAVQTVNGGNIEGFSAVDFTNASGVPLKVTSIQLPTLAQCFPAGFGNLMPAGAPAPNPPQACAVGSTLAPGAVCRVDVESVCRSLATASTATISVTLSTLWFAASGTGVVTVTNTSLANAATNLAPTVPGGSNLAVQSTTCGASLAPAASCTVTFTGAVPEGPTAVAVLGSNTNSGSVSVTVTAPAPTLVASAPTTGPAAGGTLVTLSGTGFVVGNTSVSIGGAVIPAASVTVNSATSLSFITPAHAAGNVNLSVTAPGGVATLLGGFTYEAGPTINAITPSTGLSAGGSAITLSGTNLTGTTSVAFDGVPAASFTVNSATQITAVTPAHVPGVVDVVVTTPDGSATLNNGFIYVSPT